MKTKRINHTTSISNVLVIGSGGAGLRAAIEAKLSGVEVTVIGKRIKEDVHTVLAAGGINAAFGNVDHKDSWQQHFADTIIEGYGLSNPKMVEIMAKEAPKLFQDIERIYECSYIIHLKREIEIADKYRTNELRLKSITDMEVFPS